ncbi:hypothetical protein B0H19DRAFT_1367708 [Mycena capillaripes]|nr:hypothetical protein B0H19DRAFT_1367708 [Mycena capillaripes]
MKLILLSLAQLGLLSFQLFRTPVALALAHPVRLDLADRAPAALDAAGLNLYHEREKTASNRVQHLPFRNSPSEHDDGEPPYHDRHVRRQEEDGGIPPYRHDRSSPHLPFRGYPSESDSELAANDSRVNGPEHVPFSEYPAEE